MRNDYPIAMTRPRAFILLSALSALALAAPAVDAQRFSRDQDEAREHMLDRKMLPFSVIKRKTEQAMAGEASYVGTAPNPREGVYRMQFLRKDGKVIWVDVDGKTGEIIARTK